MANCDQLRDRTFSESPSDVLGHATSDILIGSKLNPDVMKKNMENSSNLPGRRTIRWTRR